MELHYLAALPRRPNMKRLFRGIALGEWYVLALEPSREFIALLGLHQRNVTAWLPAMITQRRIRGRLVEVRRPLLGRYAFAQGRQDEIAGWMDIPGVWGCLPHGRPPEAVPGHVVEELRVRELAGEFRFADTVTGRRRHRRVLRSLRELGVLQEALAA
jgi:hypothetical protein